MNLTNKPLGKETERPGRFRAGDLLSEMPRLGSADRFTGRLNQVSADEAKDRVRLSEMAAAMDLNVPHNVVSVVVLEPTPSEAVMGGRRALVAVQGYRENAKAYFVESQT